MRKFLIAVAACLTMLLCSCGHNAITYGDGVGFDFGVNPEKFTMSMNLRYGKILSAVVRDNTEIELTGKPMPTEKAVLPEKPGLPLTAISKSKLAGKSTELL